MASLPEWRPLIRCEHDYEKAGFVHADTLRHARFTRGECMDVHVMSLLRDEWATRRPRS